jgi:glycosyltransferase involved in cell wall biosynthesis
MSVVHVVVPDGLDDPGRSSGGNTFDRRVCDGLAERGWTVHMHAVPDAAALAPAVAAIPDGAVVLLDGLVASSAPEVLVPEAERLQLVVLVHMLFEHERERAVLSSASAVVTTSRWARRTLLQLYAVRPDRVHVAEPGVDEAALSPGTAAGGSMLTVAAVIPGKGHDVLLEALAMLPSRDWSCLCVGSLERDAAFAHALRSQAVAGGIDGRVRFAGPQTGPDLSRSYGSGDVLVLPSRGETYGMVIAEALARGLPVVASDVGGVPEAMGRGNRPGLLVPPDDPVALRDALRAWLEDAGLRHRLRQAARARRASLTRWSTTVRVVEGVLVEASR